MSFNNKSTDIIQVSGKTDKVQSVIDKSCINFDKTKIQQKYFRNVKKRK